MESLKDQGLIRLVPLEIGFYDGTTNQKKIEEHLRQDIQSLEECSLGNGLIWLRVARQLFKVYGNQKNWPWALEILYACMKASEKEFRLQNLETLPYGKYWAELMTKFKDVAGERSKYGGRGIPFQ